MRPFGFCEAKALDLNCGDFFLSGGSHFGNQLLSEGVVCVQAGTGGNQLTNDNVLLQTGQVVLLALDGSLGQDLGGLLEGCGRQDLRLWLI